jgi:D-amino peptidase
MRAFVVTDLEGVAGVDSFDQTRTADTTPERKGEAMDLLAGEVNACVAGIRDAAPDAEVDVWDGHGSGGLREADVADATYLREGKPYFELDHDAVLFVGQHAMAGAAFAPLRHTYSSRRVAYFRLNGTFVGEFGCRALVAGLQGVPTVFLAGDDKATLEARAFVPGIETTAVKHGTGVESAEHLDVAAAREAVREGAARAISRRAEIPPLDGIEPPHTLEIRYYDPLEEFPDEGVTRVDSRTVRIESDDLLAPDSPMRGYL